MPSRVVRQSARVGAILPTRTQVTFAVVPR
jgi:hypothetical protein